MKPLVIQAAVLMVVPVIMLVSLHVASTSIPRPTEFNTAQQLKDFAVSNGLIFHCGNRNGIIYGNYFLADHAIAIDDLAGVSMRRDCGLTPAWHGVLWVSPLTEFGPYPDLIGGKWRVWGNVLVAGDQDLMDRIEELYRNQ
jgi:hypothetical protein